MTPLHPLFLRMELGRIHQAKTHLVIRKHLAQIHWFRRPKRTRSLRFVNMARVVRESERTLRPIEVAIQRTLNQETVRRPSPFSIHVVRWITPGGCPLATHVVVLSKHDRSIHVQSSEFQSAVETNRQSYR